jgi:hypothetical protein
LRGKAISPTAPTIACRAAFVFSKLHGFRQLITRRGVMRDTGGGRNNYQGGRRRRLLAAIPDDDC